MVIGIGATGLHARGREGYSLVELMVVAALLGLLFNILPKAISQIMVQSRLTADNAELQTEARNSMDEIHRLIRLGTSLNINWAAGQPPYSRLVITTTAGNILVYQDGPRLMAVEPSGLTRTLSQNLSCLVFSRADGVSNRFVTATLTFEKITLGQRRARHVILRDMEAKG